MSSMPLRLSLLDQSPVSAGSTSADALRRSLDLAQLADRLGYTRYWVAEHHGTTMLACASPEVLIGPIAALTRRIRVGSGGVMLPHYSPLKVAETFTMFSGLFPHRIDLALGRAAGTDPLTAYALQRDRRQAAPDDFPQQLVELLAYLHDTLPAGHRFARLANLPGSPGRPAPWLLGSSPQSAVWAAELGLPYAFADFINPNGAAIARRYRETFQPSRALSEPYVIVSSWALCAETDADANRIASSARMGFVRFLQGQPEPVPSVETAVAFLDANPDAASALGHHRRWTVGTPTRVREQLEAIAHEYGADEVMVVTITHGHDTRCRSYELLAEAFRIPSSSSDAHVSAGTTPRETQRSA
ncbi:MAG: LLM class flavin-dependent oxidoreductase [Acidimicrobiia bacterium]|nr:LLM class flavin-dependent oxidoreductase [Acidimicrobiia bacterium]